MKQNTFKKGWLILPVLLALLVAVAVAPYAATPTQEPDPATTGVNAQIDFTTTTTCPACGARNVTWKPLPQATSTTVLKDGHYYVPEGGLVNTVAYSFDATNLPTTDGQLAKGRCIHLNGSTINSSAWTVFSVTNGIQLHIFGSGTITGNTNGTSNKMGTVATLYTGYVHFMGGTYTAGNGNLINLTSDNSYAYLYAGATLTGGKVTTENTAGNVQVEKGTFTMYGGNIVNGQGHSGGNVFARGKFIMQNGTISGGKANSGGNVNVYGGGSFKMTGGSVTGGEATYGGGNLYMGSQYGTLTVAGGTVSNGVSKGDGGNIFANNGALTLSGGTVSGGKAVNGGNVYSVAGVLDAQDYFTVKDDGDAATAAPVITGGKATGMGGNVYLKGIMNLQAGTITLGEAANGGNIAIYSAPATEDADGNPVAAEKNKAKLTVTGGTISNGTATASGGNLYISSHAANNLTVTMTGGSFSGGSANDGGSMYITYTKLSLSGGSITGGKAVTAGNVYAGAGCQFTMTGGSVTNGKATSESSSSGRGGNFYMSSLNSSVTIKAGTISGGEANYLGGNVCVNNGNLTINGGTVSGGNAQSGGNIYTYAGTNSQAPITNNTTVADIADDDYAAPVITGGVATKYGGNIFVDGRFVLGNCTVEKGEAGESVAQIYLNTNAKLTVKKDYAGQCTVAMTSAKLPSPLYGSQVEDFTGEGVYTGRLTITNATGKPLLVGKEGDTGLYISSAALVGKDGTYTWYNDNASMMAAYDADAVSYVQAGIGEFPLNGQTVLVDIANQNVNFTGNGTVTCFDSANDSYRYSGSAVFGENVTLANRGLAQINGKQYYALNDNGTYSFRRLELEITGVSLRPGTSGLYYIGQWKCDAELAKHIGTYGIAVSLANMPEADFAISDERDTMWTAFANDGTASNNKMTGILVNNILKTDSADRIAKNAQYAKMPIYAVAYLTVDGQCYVGEGVQYSLQDVLGIIDENITDYATAASTMRSFMEKWNDYGLSGAEWNFTYEVSEDIVKLQTLYGSTNAYHGEMHDHSNSGGTSDGKVTLDRWKEEMEKLGMDFATIVDHKQVLHMEHPEWNNDVFVGGTELSVNVYDSGGKGNFHYNMIFSSVKDLENVLFAFPELEYKQNETTGEWHFIYPAMSRARMEELIACIRANNGQFVHVHPKYDNYLKSDDPLVYWFADYTGLEITTGSGGNMGYTDNQEAYELWVALLNLGKKVYATAGSDKHSAPNTSALTTMYAASANADGYLNNMRSGCFTAGSVGIRMAVGNTVMGGETAFDGQRLMVSVGDFHKSAVIDGHTYKVEIYADDQVVHTAQVDPEETFYYAMDADKDVSYYRVVVWDETENVRIAVGNPIWNVK